MTFRPMDGQGDERFNSYRIKHLLLSPYTTKVQPWFQIDYMLQGCVSNPCSDQEIDSFFGFDVNFLVSTAPYDGTKVEDVEGLEPTFSQQVWVLPVNQNPKISDPQEGYLDGCKTRTPCVVDGKPKMFSLFETSGPNFYFGQYWRWEASYDPLTISQIATSDVDVDEFCIFEQLSPCKFLGDPAKYYRCGKMDFNARVLLGTIELNSIDDLAFYTNTRSAKGFAAVTRYMDQATKAFTYRVESSERILSGQSNVMTANTQYDGAQEEFLLIRVSDQGNFGDTGQSAVAFDKKGSEGLRIKITIAAVNTAPTLVTPIDFTAYEDQPLHMAGLECNDIDVEEKITSLYAMEDWLQMTRNQFYVNKLRITAELKGYGNNKGRGLLFFNSDARDLFVVSNGSQVFLSIRSVNIDNYACAARPVIFRPGKYECGKGSLPTVVGQRCGGDWDLKTCSFVSQGKVFMATNSTIVLGKNHTSLEPWLKTRLDCTTESLSVCHQNRPSLSSLARTWVPRYRLEITDGPSRGMAGFLQLYDPQNASVTLWSEGLESRGVPRVGDSWAIYMNPQAGQCEYKGSELLKVCAHATTPELAPFCLSRCPVGQETSGDKRCDCIVIDSCGVDGQYRLHLNFTKPGVQEYIAQLMSGLDNLNKTCGGLPMRRAPFTSALAKRCNMDSDCSEKTFARCIAGETCKCCGNLTATCSTNADCNDFGNPWETNQYCGCTAGYSDAQSLWSTTDKACCANLSATCTSDDDCRQYLAGSKCGCASYYPMCGPYTESGARAAAGKETQKLIGGKYVYVVEEETVFPQYVGYGQPCTYRYPLKKLATCESGIFAVEGTRDSRIFSQVVFLAKDFETKDMAGKGSTRIEFYGERLLVVLALRGLRYLTYNPSYPYYNRLYRLPLSDRDPATFKIDANDYDVLHVTVDDMGNSGGSLRDPRKVSKILPIVVLAVNNGPILSGPRHILAVEDVPLNIINDLDSNPPKYGINVTDPDQTNFGFNDPRVVVGQTLGFEINLTVQHGCLFVNETFLRYGPEYFNRKLSGVPAAVVGDKNCPLNVPFDLGGCTIRLKDYGQNKSGLHALRCLDAQCKTTVMAPCYSHESPAVAKHCYGGRACAKMLAFEGRFPDINTLLSNVTYLSDPDFNTGYGYSEELLIEVSDNGIIGDPPIEVLKDRLVIPITVIPVNDAPIIGRLYQAECLDMRPDGLIFLSDFRLEQRVFAIEPALDRIDVNEDTEFTIMPDRLWIADVDAEEAEARSSHVDPKCAGQCGSVVADPKTGCCIIDRCPKLCNKMNLVSEGGLPSEVLVEFKVDYGKITFYPPPTRSQIRGITYMTNLSLADIKAPRYAIEKCSNQLACARNQSRIWIRTRIPNLQKALSQGFLRYVGKENWAGIDMLYIWVSDDGYSDQNYSKPLSAEAKLPIGVIAINDDPVISYPGGEGCKQRDCSNSIPPTLCATDPITCATVPPLQYVKAQYCKNDWMLYGGTDPWPTGIGAECKKSNISKIPNIQPMYEKFPMLKKKIEFSDVDMNETPYGNITVVIKIGRPNAGLFQIKETFSTVSLYQYHDESEYLNLRVRGKIRDVNAMMEMIYFDALDDYSGPAPFEIVAVDNNNFGICTPKSSQRLNPYKCNRVDCNNIYSGASLANRFVCGYPTGKDNSVISYHPGAKISCSDRRKLPMQCPAGCRGPYKERNKVLCKDVRSDCARIEVRQSGDWSGPWSCLGCGFFNQNTRQVEFVDEENPSIPGLSRATVDVMVGGAAICKYDTCSVCNAASRYSAQPLGDGCGWCPSVCGGKGKCMIEVGGRPVFETCSTDPSLPLPGNLPYRQCRQEPLNLGVIAGGVVAGLLSLYGSYVLVKWLQRRHGSIVVYLKKKRFDITYHGRKMKIIPPEGAYYLLFATTIFCVFVLGLYFSGYLLIILLGERGPFVFNIDTYFDTLTSLQFDLDNCNLRFLPTRNFQGATAKIDNMKVRWALYEHEDIMLDMESCLPAVRFTVKNTRPPAQKYDKYYCNVQVLIPDRYVLPTTTINAIGSNLTTVRSGPMDEDTRNFGLEFGANFFVMKGELMQARLDNISAKHFKYDVMHGSLLATNITKTPYATFNSLTADISVMTTGMTTVYFWQKSANLMCLSAGTLFVDSNCAKKCDYVPMDGPPPIVDESGSDFRKFERFYRRRHSIRENVNETLQIHKVLDDDVGDDGDGGGEHNGTQRRQLSQGIQCNAKGIKVLDVPGCVTPECTLSQTPQCLCKPTCDMVPAEKLDFLGNKGVAGECDEEGKCCRLLCGGYSSADMFPYPNTVRCGTCVKETDCQMPQCGLWSSGKLQQQWYFTSASGQMSLAVLDHDSGLKYYDPGATTTIECSSNPYLPECTAWRTDKQTTLLHSYQGGNKPQINPMSKITLDFNFGDKLGLDPVFHAGGLSRPTVDWFWLRVAGPGAPPQTLGSLVWTSSIRFIVIPDYFLKVVSNDYLNPKKKAGSARLRPGFCPPVLKDDDPLVLKRIISVFQLFSRTLQYFPEDQQARQFPVGSLIAWIPLEGPPAQFILDKDSNEFGFSKIDPWTGDGPILYLIVLLSVVFPLAIASVLIFTGVSRYRSFLFDLRQAKLRRENSSLNIYEQARVEKLPIQEKEVKLEISPETLNEMTARTSFFYMVDYSIGVSDLQRDWILEMACSFPHLCVFGVPVLYINYVSNTWEAGYKAYYCESVVAQGTCYARPEPISQLLNFACLWLVVITVCELTNYYLKMAYTFTPRIVRILFYGTYVFTLWLAIFLCHLNLFWIFLGVLQKPGILAPYLIGGASIFCNTVSYYSKLMRFRMRVIHQVNKRIVIFTNELGDKYPKRVIESVIDGNLEAALVENGLSHSSVVFKTFGLVVFLIVLHSFIFVGFQVYVFPLSR